MLLVLCAAIQAGLMFWHLLWHWGQITSAPEQRAQEQAATTSQFKMGGPYDPTPTSEPPPRGQEPGCTCPEIHDNTFRQELSSATVTFKPCPVHPLQVWNAPRPAAKGK